ncbi:MAG: cyclase family protein [Candidatus Thermoplasmatota archaeon]|nr:cyclase family protein [Candidatus Thermoplasmatota archaeon]
MYIDLTMPLDEETMVFPGSSKPEIITISTIESKGYNEKKVSFSLHTSTHIDAPRHMLINGKTLSDFTIDNFIGEAIVLDVSNQKEINVDLSNVRKNEIVFFYTGWSRYTDKSNYFTDNPVLSEKTAQRLIEKQVKIIGIDSFTPDNEPFFIHKMLFKHDILIVENLVNLESLIGKRFLCYILPLKIKDADGAPCRVIAEFD